MILDSFRRFSVLLGHVLAHADPDRLIIWRSPTCSAGVESGPTLRLKGSPLKTKVIEVIVRN